MTRITIMLMTVALVAACGGGDRNKRLYGGGGYSAPSRAPAVVDRTRFALARGPISSACLSAGRKAANRSLCGCVQTVANRSLTPADQRLAASFFSNPQKAQDVRQSDNTSREAFWKRYKAFGQAAERTCKGL